MSEFVAHIRAELDTSEAEQKLKNLTDGKHKIKLEPEINTDEVDKKTPLYNFLALYKKYRTRYFP